MSAVLTRVGAPAAARFAALHGMRPEEAAGLIQARIARSTGTLVEVYDANEAGQEDEGYSTVCGDHGRLVIHPSLSLARAHAADPGGWCGACNGSEPDEDEEYDDEGNLL